MSREFDIYVSKTTSGEHNFIVDADCYNNDSGIGVYECWGFRGFDSHKFLACEIESVYLIWHGRRRKIKTSMLKKETMKEIEDLVYQKAESELQECKID